VGNGVIHLDELATAIIQQVRCFCQLLILYHTTSNLSSLAIRATPLPNRPS